MGFVVQNTFAALLRSAVSNPVSLLTCPAIQTLPRALAAALSAAVDSVGAEITLTESPEILTDTLAALTLLGADGESLLAALLDGVPAWAEAIAPHLPPAHAAVLTLLDGQREAERVWALYAERAGRGNPEGLRRLLLAIVRDLRVVSILLARQLARMRALPSRPEPEQRALAKLTRDIHAPLANRLGIWQLKWELEDLAFRHLEPGAYRQIARLLDDKRIGRERYIEAVKTELGHALAAQGIDADIAGRPKHIYSIWKKMQKKRVPIDELYDLRAVRVLVEDIPACYAALGIVHAMWAPVPGEFDDYIARPKNNDYRSLHTAVIGPEGKTLEVQIRTRQMHAEAELGVAAHWRYKETGGSQRGSAANAAMDRRIEWMRRLLEAHTGSDDAGLAEGLNTELIEDRVYVLTPKGEVLDLPAGATVLDFAYQVHTMVGHRCRGAKVDGRIVPLTFVLRSGQRVDILTGKHAEPRRDWLVAANGYLMSPRSREKVRAFFHKLDRERNLIAGRELLERELRRLGLMQAPLQPILSRFNVTTVDDLLVLIALGDVGPHQVGRALLELERAASEPSAQDTAPRLPRKIPKPAKSAFTVVGVGNLLTQIARCCHPLPGEAIAGYLTKTRGVSVHRQDCPAFQRLSVQHPQRVLPVEWGRGDGGGHEVGVVIDVIDRRHLLKDLTTLFAQEDVHVLSIRSEQGAHARQRLHVSLRLGDYGQFAKLMGKIDSMPGVERTRRE